MTPSESVTEEHKSPLEETDFSSQAQVNKPPVESTPSNETADARPVTRWTTKYRIELLLFALLFGSYAYFYQSTHHNEASRIDQMRAIIQNHTLEINKYWWNTADVIHYSKNGSDRI